MEVATAMTRTDLAGGCFCVSSSGLQICRENVTGGHSTKRIRPQGQYGTPRYFIFRGNLGAKRFVLFTGVAGNCGAAEESEA